jgi:hypothetical protein
VRAASAASGTAALGFEAVCGPCELILAEHGETGGAFTTMAGGRLAADLVRGVRARTLPTVLHEAPPVR